MRRIRPLLRTSIALLTLGLLQGTPPRSAHAQTAPLGASKLFRQSQDVAHPISVRVTALDPVGRGRTVRLRVRVTSAIPVERAEVTLTGVAGTATRVGGAYAQLGTVAPGRERSADFTVAIPSGGGRGYAQFLVRAEGPLGTLRRGAAFNLLPDGPDQLPRTVALPSGGNTLEFSARRIEP